MDKSDKDRKQLNIRVEVELYDFLAQYAKNNYKSVTAVIREMIVDLYKANKIPLVYEHEEN